MIFSNNFPESKGAHCLKLRPASFSAAIIHPLSTNGRVPRDCCRAVNSWKKGNYGQEDQLKLTAELVGRAAGFFTRPKGEISVPSCLGLCTPPPWRHARIPCSTASTSTET